MHHVSEEARIAQLIGRLTDAHPDLPAEQVAQAVREAVAHFGEAPIRDYVVLLAERRARKQLVNKKPA
jgi:hypothetical protein